MTLRRDITSELGTSDKSSDDNYRFLSKVAGLQYRTLYNALLIIDKLSDQKFLVVLIIRLSKVYVF